MCGDVIVGSDLPAAVELAVAETEPGVQGDCVSGARKPATLETGLVLQVPLFVNPGERTKVDTRSGEHITRARCPAPPSGAPRAPGRCDCSTGQRPRGGAGPRGGGKTGGR